jgi:predicted Ser/Thr protein kinase
MNNLVNTSLGQYYLTEIIGRGSTSVVYKAYQSSLNRYVAVKVLAADIDPQFEMRFRREAQAVAQLQHPNILPIYDFGEEGGRPYFVMQYVEGSQTLDQALAGRPFEPVAALRLMLPLLAALQYAHDRGVIHRDIKPANIMLPQPEWPLLADFGIAKMLDDSQPLTPPGQSVGTAIYMAPERASSAGVNARADLYAIGVVLYEMLTGQVPFDGTSPVEVLRKHIHAPVPPPREINPTLPPAVDTVLLRALEKDPSRRFASAAEMAAAIQRLIGQFERLQAQRQLQDLLGKPAVAPPAGLGHSPYETRELTETGMSVVRQRNNRMSAAILSIALLLAFGGFLAARAAAGRTQASGEAPTASSALGATSPAGAAVVPTSAPTQAPTAQTAAAPTAAVPTGAPATAGPATAQATTAPTRAVPTQVPAPSPPSTAQNGGATTIRFEDADWQGGFQPAAGRTYGGRSATWIYGSSTEYSTMRAQFTADGDLAGTATLTVEGMDSEGRPKTPISIKVNGVEIYNGPNPLPDDDIPLDTGTWASYSWTFDAALLRVGRNEVSISNLEPGAFSRPPFFMLDFAELSVGE